MIEKTKHKLKFREDGTFRVLMMSDLQESTHYDPRSLRSVEVLVDEADPDLVVFGGDNCNGHEISSEEELKEFLSIFTSVLETRQIPWAHVFGNHDHEVPIDIDVHQSVYESFPMCVSSHTGDDVHGKTNFLLPVYNKNDEPALAIWCLDTNYTVDSKQEWICELSRNGSRLPFEPNTISNEIGFWGALFADQLLWYNDKSVELEKMAGKKVPGLLCMHIGVKAFCLAQSSPKDYIKSGNYDEVFNGLALDPGLFEMLKHRADIIGISCGHTHRNDFEAEVDGIRLFWDASVGYRCYGVDERRGGRLFIFNEKNPTEFKSRMIRTLGK